MAEETLFHIISRIFKHVTLMTCILVAGNTRCPMVITANPISDSFWINNLRQDEDAMIRRQIPPYIDETLFY
jgi:hypothetical protein